MNVLKTLKTFLNPADSSAPAPDPAVQAEQERQSTIREVRSHLKSMAELAQNLEGPVLQNANRFLFYANTLLSGDISCADLRYLAQYVPHVEKLLHGHVKWRLENINDLNMLHSLICSKSLIERFANVLQDRCDRIEKMRNISSRAEMKALDSILKMNGF